MWFLEGLEFGAYSRYAPRFVKSNFSNRFEITLRFTRPRRLSWLPTARKQVSRRSWARPCCRRLRQRRSGRSVLLEDAQLGTRGGGRGWPLRGGVVPAGVHKRRLSAFPDVVGHLEAGSQAATHIGSRDGVDDALLPGPEDGLGRFGRESREVSEGMDSQAAADEKDALGA